MKKPSGRSPRRSQAQRRPAKRVVAVSNPCFELWLVLHAREQTAFISRHDVQRLSETAALRSVIEDGIRMKLRSERARTSFRLRDLACRCGHMWLYSTGDFRRHPRTQRQPEPLHSAD